MLHRTRGSSNSPLIPRDVEIIRRVGEFRQLTSTHLKTLIFPDVSRVNLDRRLERLQATQYLRRLGRVPAGEKGGSGAYVWQLGPAGWYELSMRGFYSPRSTIDYHGLQVADAYVVLIEAERAGALTLVNYRVELPMTYTRADLYIEIGLDAINKERHIAVEIEATRKRPSYIAKKCEHYMAGFKEADGGVIPYVVFVVPHEWMKAEVKRTLAKVSGEYRDMFKVCTFDGYVPLLTAP